MPQDYESLPSRYRFSVGMDGVTAASPPDRGRVELKENSVVAFLLYEILRELRAIHNHADRSG